MPTEGYESLLDYLRNWETAIQKDKRSRKNLMDDLIDEEHRYDLVWCLGDNVIFVSEEKGKQYLDSLVKGIRFTDGSEENPREGDVRFDPEEEQLVAFNGEEWLVVGALQQ